MAKDISKLRKENDELKTQVADLGRELSKIQSKMATFNAEASEKELDKSVQFLSEEYDGFKAFKVSMEGEIRRMSSRLKDVEENVYKIDDAIESILKYSYQYNVKILGIKQKNASESSRDTVDLCLALFKEIGAKVAEYDIDIAHRVPSRNSNFPPPIICKFTRRVAKESVMEFKKRMADIDLDDIGLESSGKVGIFDHLTPNTQALFNKAKAFQKEHKYAFCWTKNSSILLKETSESNIIRITSPDVLRKLAQNTSYYGPSGVFPPAWGPQPAQFDFGHPAMEHPAPIAGSSRGRPRTRSSMQQS